MNERILVRILPPFLLVSSLARGQAAPPTPLTLGRAVEMALARAPELAVYRARAEEGAAAARLLNRPARPDIFVTSTPGYSVGIPLAVAGRAPALFGAEAHASLYDSFRRTERLETEAQAEALEGALAAARTDAVRSVLLTYARCAADQALAGSARQRLETQEALHARVAARHREGRETDLDLERSALEVARARQKALEAASDLDLDRLELARLTGLQPGGPLVLADDPLSALADPSGDHLEAARASDPHLRSLANEIAALSTSAALSARWFQPAVDAQVQYARVFKGSGYEDFYLSFKPDAFTVGVSLAVPVWSSGRQAERASRIQARLEGLKAERTLREVNLEFATRKAEAALAASAASRSLARRARGVAEEALRLGRVMDAEGRAEPGAVERAALALAAAQDDLTRADFEAFAARVTLRGLRGELPDPAGARVAVSATRAPD